VVYYIFVYVTQNAVQSRVAKNGVVYAET